MEQREGVSQKIASEFAEIHSCGAQLRCYTKVEQIDKMNKIEYN